MIAFEIHINGVRLRTFYMTLYMINIQCNNRMIVLNIYKTGNFRIGVNVRQPQEHSLNDAFKKFQESGGPGHKLVRRWE